MAIRHMKRCSTSLTINEMKFKTVMRYHLTSVRMSIIIKINYKCWWGCGEKRTLLYCWWECRLILPLWKTVWRWHKKVKIELPHDLAILGAYLKTKTKTKALIQKDICTLMFIPALFTVTKMWKQPQCVIIRWMEYYFNGVLLSHKKNEILLFAATQMDLEGIMLGEISQRKTNAVWYHLYVEFKNKN